MTHDPRQFRMNLILTILLVALAAWFARSGSEEGLKQAGLVVGGVLLLWRHSGRRPPRPPLAGSGGAAPRGGGPADVDRRLAQLKASMAPACLAVLAFAGCKVERLEPAWPSWLTRGVGPLIGKPVRADSVELTPQSPGGFTCPSGKVCIGASSTSGRARHLDSSGTGLDWGDARNFRVLAAAPSGAVGDVYYNSVTGKYAWYAGGAFGALPKNSGGFGVDVSTGLTPNHIAYVDGGGALIIGAAPAAVLAAHASTHLPGGSDALTTAAPANVGTANAEGAAASFARSDHVHNLPFGPVQTALAAASGAIAANSQKITGLGQGTSSGEALHAGRSVATTAPLSGGGPLTGDLTLSIGAASASAAGSMSQADFIKLRDLAGAVFACTATQTTDATATTAGTYTPADGKVVVVHAQVSGRKNDGSEAGGYVLAATYRRAAGTTTQVGATTAIATHEDTAGWDATLDASGTDVRVRVTGAAATTVDWLCNAMVTIVP